MKFFCRSENLIIFIKFYVPPEVHNEMDDIAITLIRDSTRKYVLCAYNPHSTSWDSNYYSHITGKDTERLSNLSNVTN